MSLLHTRTHIHLTPATCCCSSSTLSVPCTDKDFSLDSVRSVLLDERAIPCECHVIDDTPRFLAIGIMNTSVCDCSVADSFLTSSLSLLHTSTHIHLTPATCGSFYLLGWCCWMKELARLSLQPGLCYDGAAG